MKKELLQRKKRTFLRFGKSEHANEYCEKVIDNDPECAEAYLGKLMVELKVQKREQLRGIKKSFEKNANYQKAVKFGDKFLRDELEKYTSEIEARNKRDKSPKKNNGKVVLVLAILAVILVSAVAFNSNFSLGYTLEHNGEVLAYVESEEVFSEAKNIAAGKIFECEYTFEAEEFEIEKGLLYQKTFSDENEISDLILENTENIYAAEGFYVDGEFIGTTDSKDEWEDILEEYKENYRREGDDSELSFEEKIEFKEGFYEISTFISTQDFEILLDEGKGENLYHTVAEGESSSEIAEMYDLYMHDLTRMNPELSENENVEVGQELLVGENPYFTVVSPISGEELEHKLVYNEAKSIDIKDSATKKQVKELLEKLPDDYPGKEELLAAVEEYEKNEKKTANSGGNSGNPFKEYQERILRALQGRWVNEDGIELVISGNTFTMYKDGRVWVKEFMTANGIKSHIMTGTITYVRYETIPEYLFLRSIYKDGESAGETGMTLSGWEHKLKEIEGGILNIRMFVDVRTTFIKL